MKRLLALILIAASTAHALPMDRCENELVMNGPTKSLVSYLATLVDRQIVGDTELATLIEGLDSDALVNPISESTVATSSARLIHREKIRKLLDASGIELGLLRDWALSALKEKSLVQKKREKIKEETRDFFEKKEFVQVPGGPVHANNVAGQFSIYDIRPFAVMKTPITQKMWVEVMGENPSHFKSGAFSGEFSFKGKRVELQPNNPVENITWWSAVVFANRLSKIHDLPPVYNLDGMTFLGNDVLGDAARGVLQAKSGTVGIDSESSQLIEEHPGFRLPTYMEMDYLFEHLILDTTRADAVTLTKHAIFDDGSNPHSGTQPVAQRQPFTFAMAKDRLELFDLLGNVAIWLHSAYRGADARRGEDGAAWSDGIYFLNQRPGRTRLPNDRYDSIGIRLVRSLPK